MTMEDKKEMVELIGGVMEEMIIPRFDKLEEDVSGLKKDVAGLEIRMSGLDGRMENMENRVEIERHDRLSVKSDDHENRIVKLELVRS